MKKIFLTLIVLFIAMMPLLAQDPPPPPTQGTNTGTNGPPIGGGAPIGSGLLLLVGMGAAYGGKKVYDIRKRKLVE